MNRGELRTEVQAVIGNIDTSIASQINNWLNWSTLQMARRFDWSALISLDKTTYSTTAGTQTVSLNSTVKKLYDIRYVDEADDSKSRQLLYRPAWVSNRLTPYPPGDAQNTPVYYWVTGAIIYLYPIPDESKTLYVTINSWPTDMSTDSEEPSISMVDDAIVAGAVARAYKSLPQLDGADLLKVWDREFDKLTAESNLVDRKLGGWRPVMRMHNAYGSRFTNDPVADPFNVRGNYTNRGT